MGLRLALAAALLAAALAATIDRDGSVTPRDIIVAMQGQPVDNVGKLIGRLDDFRAGETVRLTILREGRRIEVPVVLQPGR